MNVLYSYKVLNFISVSVQISKAEFKCEFDLKVPRTWFQTRSLSVNKAAAVCEVDFESAVSLNCANKTLVQTTIVLKN